MAKKIINRNVTVILLIVTGFTVYNILANAGSLQPSAPPGSTMKTLQEVEPRTLIDSLPFVINFSGSYYVTASLSGSPVADGITINADDVTLDLRGFTLTGVLEVQPNDGIVVNGVHENITIHNGVLRNWVTAINANAATNSQVRNVRVQGNGGDGINIGDGGSVVQCSAQSNAGRGIVTGDGSMITECTARGNSNIGIETGQGSTVTACTASTNTADGIYVRTGGTVSGCTAWQNGYHGILTHLGCTVVNCTSRENGLNGIHVASGSTVSGCTASLNTGDGIRANGNSRIVGNNCDSNGNLGDGAGIHVTNSGNRVEANNVTDNDRGLDVDGTSNIIVKNTASGNTTHYDIAADNSFGPEVNVFESGDISSKPYSDHPWANFRF